MRECQREGSGLAANVVVELLGGHLLSIPAQNRTFTGNLASE